MLDQFVEKSIIAVAVEENAALASKSLLNTLPF